MKTGIFAICTTILIVTLVSANSVVLHKSITGFIEDAESLATDDTDAYSNAEKIKNKFEDLEWYVSLTVNHEDLTNIEECYADLIGYLAVDNLSEAEVTKNRLIDALMHLRRLSGVNIDSII